MKVLVCGGRHYNDAEAMAKALDRIELETGKSIDVVIEGGAGGADSLAFKWAAKHRRGSHTFMADWNTHGRAAGPIRNQQMLDEGKPDLVIAFPGGRGTADMMRRARKAGVRVIEVRAE